MPTMPPQGATHEGATTQSLRVICAPASGSTLWLAAVHLQSWLASTRILSRPAGLGASLGFCATLAACRYDLDAWFHVGDWLYESSIAVDSVRFDLPPQGVPGPMSLCSRQALSCMTAEGGFLRPCTGSSQMAVTSEQRHPASNSLCLRDRLNMPMLTIAFVQAFSPHMTFRPWRTTVPGMRCIAETLAFV